MKKRFAFLLAAGMALLPSTSVMAAEDVIGEWYGTTGNYPFIVELEKDGKCTVTVKDGEEEHSETGEWKQDGDVITVTDGESPTELYIREDGKSLEADGMGMILTRDAENAEPFVAAEVVSDAALEDMNGKWSVTRLLKYEMLCKPLEFEIEEGVIEIKDNLVDFKMVAGFMIGEWDLKGLEGTFEDGCLSFEIPPESEYEEPIPCTVKLLEDGLLEVAHSSGTEFETLYYMEAVE